MRTATIPSPLLGCAVGDALGKFAETMTPAQQAAVEWDENSYLPGNYPNLPPPYRNDDELLNRPGVPTDDTQMARALARSLVAQKGYNAGSALDEYCDWFHGRSFVGAPRGIGGTIRNALQHRFPPHLSPEAPCGTGAAMRIGVLGATGLDPLSLFHNAIVDARLTHDHPEAMACSVAMVAAVHLARCCREGTLVAVGHPVLDPQDFHRNLPEYILAVLTGVGMGHSATAWAIRHTIMVVTSLRSEGYLPAYQRWGVGASPFLIGDDVVSVTATAILCAAMAFDYLDGVRMAIRLGGDTDTRAAMAGTILGTWYGAGGMDGIPSWAIQGLYEADAIRHEDLLVYGCCLR